MKVKLLSGAILFFALVSCIGKEKTSHLSGLELGGYL
jgi:hypothetical protein